MRRLASRSSAVGACVWMLLGCGARQHTQRVFDGQSVVGAYVEPEAYAAFAEGVYLEEHGEREGAVRAYRRALARDPDSPGIGTRLGALMCRTSLEAALEELHTDGVARNYAPAWAEQARCLHQHGEAARALEAALRAVSLDGGNPEANLLIAQVHREQARPELARAWLFAWALSDPGAAAYWKVIEAQAILLADDALGAFARTELARRARNDDSDPRAADGPEEPQTVIEATPQALARGLRAGQTEQALSQAERLLGANPEDGDALVAALFASMLLRDEVRFAKLLERAAPGARPHPELAPFMADILRWRVGDDAARRWLAAYGVAAPARR